MSYGLDSLARLLEEFIEKYINQIDLDSLEIPEDDEDTKSSNDKTDEETEGE